MVGNTYKAKVIVTDNALSVANSIYSGIITVNTALTTPTIAPTTNTLYEVGQTVTFNAFESGGSGPYTYNFQVFNAITGTLLANQLGTPNSLA